MKHYIFGEYALYIMESKMETTQTICTIVALLLIYSRKCKEKKDLEVPALSSLHATPPQPEFDISVSKVLGFKTFLFFLMVSVSVSENFGIEKSIGIGFENFGIKKSIGFEKFGVGF